MRISLIEDTGPLYDGYTYLFAVKLTESTHTVAYWHNEKTCILTVDEEDADKLTEEIRAEIKKNIKELIDGSKRDSLEEL
jgi:hypothetical protein